jgi:hypothetical protein
MNEFLLNSKNICRKINCEFKHTLVASFFHHSTFLHAFEQVDVQSALVQPVLVQVTAVFRFGSTLRPFEKQLVLLVQREAVDML